MGGWRFRGYWYWHRGWWCPRHPWPPPWARYWWPPPTIRDEISALEDLKKMLEDELREISKRLEELKAKSKD